MRFYHKVTDSETDALMLLVLDLVSRVICEFLYVPHWIYSVYTFSKNLQVLNHTQRHTHRLEIP